MTATTEKHTAASRPEEWAIADDTFEEITRAVEEHEATLRTLELLFISRLDADMGLSASDLHDVMYTVKGSARTLLDRKESWYAKRRDALVRTEEREERCAGSERPPRIFSSTGRGVYRLPFQLESGAWGLVAVARSGRAVAEAEYTDRASYHRALYDLEASLDELDPPPSESGRAACARALE